MEMRVYKEYEEDLALRQLAQGDSAVFWNIWMHYHDYLYVCCLRWMGGNHEDAEDVLSNASIRAWKTLPQHAGKITNLKGWLIRLTHNLCVDIHRERVKHARLVQHMAEITEEYEEPVANSQEPLGDAEMRRCILHAIDSLAPRLRGPTILRLLKEMPYRDIAENLSISNGNARKRIQQARVILQGDLKECLSGRDSSIWETPVFGESGLDDYEPSISAENTGSCDRAEIKPQTNFIHPVQVILPAGIEMCFYLALDHKPTRQRQKLGTLRRYVQQHPGGWKKRMQLADLLYTMGNWEEAIDAYHLVVEKQPRLIEAYLKLGEILHLTERTEEAIAVYESVLPLARKDATKCHVRGLIEACHGHNELAAQAFEEAAALEPDNAAHWHALGFAHLRSEHPAECIRVFDEALRISPDDIVALIHSHDALCAMGRVAEAQRRLTQAIEIRPENILVLKKLADGRPVRELVGGKKGRDYATDSASHASDRQNGRISTLAETEDRFPVAYTPM